MTVADCVRSSSVLAANRGAQIQACSAIGSDAPAGAHQPDQDFARGAADAMSSCREGSPGPGRVECYFNTSETAMLTSLKASS